MLYVYGIGALLRVCVHASVCSVLYHTNVPARCVELPSSALLECLGCGNISLQEDVWQDGNMWAPGEEMEIIFLFYDSVILSLRFCVAATAALF